MTQYDETMTRLTTQFTIYTNKTINKFSTFVENKNLAKALINWNENRIEIPGNVLLTKSFMKYHINNFWNEYMNKLPDKTHMLFLFRVHFNDGQIRTLCKLQQLNKEDKNYLIDILENKIQFSDDSYKTTPITKIILAFSVRSGRAEEKVVHSNAKIQTYQKYRLPVTFNPLEYGTLIVTYSINNYTYYIMKINNTNEAIIKCGENVNEVTIQRNGNMVLMYKDIKINDNTFIRQINNSEYTYVNNELKLVTTLKRTSFIDPINKDSKPNGLIFLTMDLETILRTMLNNKNKPIKVHIPYLVSYFNGSKTKSFYITDFKNHEQMIIAAINDLINYVKTIKSQDNRKVSIYLHNLGNFDIYFILPVLEKLGQLKPIIYEGRLISIKLTTPKGYSITLKDSYQLLPSSLAKLAKSFNVEDKGIYPYEFPNENNLDY